MFTIYFGDSRGITKLLQVEKFQKVFFEAQTPFSCVNGLQTGALLGVISDFQRVCTNSEVNVEGWGASHDPGVSVNACFLFNFGKKGEFSSAEKNLSENLPPVPQK